MNMTTSQMHPWNSSVIAEDNETPLWTSSVLADVYERLPWNSSVLADVYERLPWNSSDPADAYESLLWPSSVPADIAALGADSGDKYRVFVLDVFCSIVFFLLIIPVVAGNLLVLTAIYKDHRLHTPTHVLIASLALADLIVGVVTLPTFSLVHHMSIGLDLKKNICLLSYILSHCPTGVSSMTLLIISIERFIAVHYPFKYQKWFTPQLMVSLTVLAWLYVWVCLPSIMFSDNHWHEDGIKMCNFADVSSRTYRNVLLGHMIGVLFITTVLHSIVAHTAWKHKCRIAKQINIIRADIKIQRDAKTARMLAMVLGIFYLCWVPYLVTLPITSDHRGADPYWLHAWEQIGGIIVICNSFLNPVVYAWQNKIFRRAFQKILCLKKYERKPSFLRRTGRIKAIVNDNNSIHANKNNVSEDMVADNGCHDDFYGSIDTLDDSESYSLAFLKNKNIISSCEQLDKQT